MSSRSEQLYFASPAWLQNLLVSAYGYHLYRKRYNGIYRQILDFVVESRHWTPAQIQQHQSEQLYNIARHCRHKIPFYGRLFAEYGLHENDFTSPRHLDRLPVLDKQTLRQHIGQFRQPDTTAYTLQSTSGSTGTPLTLAVNEHTYKLAMALLVEHESYHGVEFGERRATFAGRMVQAQEDMRPPFARTNLAENQKLFSSYHLNANTFCWYQKTLDQFQPREIIGYPSAIYDLACHYLRTDTRPGFTPKIIVTNSETLLAWQRSTIEAVFSCPVADYYGTAEYVVFAGQDDTGRYRPSPLLGITEVIPQADTPGSGSIITTTLTNTAMPLLRYSIGDTATLGEQPEDLYGNPYILSINGREDDYLETRDHRKIGRIDHIFKDVKGIKEAQVIQEEKGHAIIRIVESESGFSDKDILVANIKKRLGADFTIQVALVSSIPRGKNGKFRAVVRVGSAKP